MTLLESLEKAIKLLEALGFRRGHDIHDDLVSAARRLNSKYPEAAQEEL